MSEDTPPPAAAASPAEAKGTPRASFADVLAQNFHAVLVGVFTLTSSIVSALLGYYFAHEDRKSMMTLEYDKLRAEHTLEIAKTLTTAEAHMISLSVDGSQALMIACGLSKQTDDLAAAIGKAKPLPPLKGTMSDKLNDIGRHLRYDVAAETRDMFSLQLDMLKSEEARIGETIAARLKSFDDLGAKLMGDTAATMHVYHRDGAENYMKLVVGFYELNTAARTLLWDAKCGSEAKFEEIAPRMMAWNLEATKFAQSLGIAIKPE